MTVNITQDTLIQGNLHVTGKVVSDGNPKDDISGSGGINIGQFGIGVGSITDGQLVSSGGVLADMPPGRLLVSDKVTSNTNITATTEATSQAIITAPSFNYDGATAVRIESRFPDANGIGAWTLNLVLWDDTAGISLGILSTYTLAASSSSGSIFLTHELVPVNGARVFSIRGYRVTANGTVNAGSGAAGNKMPGYIKITKV